jgi:gamma-glutamyl phosphate reductase
MEPPLLDEEEEITEEDSAQEIKKMHDAIRDLEKYIQDVSAEDVKNLTDDDLKDIMSDQLQTLSYREEAEALPF